MAETKVWLLLLGAPQPQSHFWRPFVKRFALCYQYQTVVCLSCPVLSITLVYCGQTVGRIKMKLSMQVGLGPGHIVTQLPLRKGHSPQIFGPFIVTWELCLHY